MRIENRTQIVPKRQRFLIIPKTPSDSFQYILPSLGSNTIESTNDSRFYTGHIDKEDFDLRDLGEQELENLRSESANAGENNNNQLPA